MTKVIKEDDGLFLEWCKNNKINVGINNDMFFINSRIVLRPKYILNRLLYVDIINENDINMKYEEYYNQFTKSYGMVMIIPREILNDLMSVTKTDLEEKFLFKL